MNQPIISPKFDCLAYKTQAQLEIYEATKNLSIPEKIAYFQSRAQSTLMGEWWQAIGSKKSLQFKTTINKA